MIIIIAIIIAFANKAGELGLNKFLWGAIGFAAYFLTQFVAGIILALVYDMMGKSIENLSEMALNFVGIIVGAICAYIAYQQMPKYAQKDQQTLEDDLLDEDMFR
ncbi:hypothetical protein [Lewinella sp. LCG006]|uniref:hypothetical protein n=1 Tax=Lewinella sp. LCG006 TaxID=3231911 RepID=UPI0034608CCC